MLHLCMSDYGLPYCLFWLKRSSRVTNRRTRALFSNGSSPKWSFIFTSLHVSEGCFNKDVKILSLIFYRNLLRKSFVLFLLFFKIKVSSTLFSRKCVIFLFAANRWHRPTTWMWSEVFQTKQYCHLLYACGAVANQRFSFFLSIKWGN